MCAELHGLTMAAGQAFNNVVGRVSGKGTAKHGQGWELVVSTPDGMRSVNVHTANLKATARPTRPSTRSLLCPTMQSASLSLLCEA